MRLRFLLLTIMVFALAACSNSGELPGNVNQAQETLEPAATAAASAVATVLTPSDSLACESLPEVTTEGDDGVTVPENAVIVFQKTGGFAGVNEVTIINADGTIPNTAMQVPPQVVDSLIGTAEDFGFFDLDRDYVPEDHCCDYFNYSLTIRDCEQVNTVLTADEVPGAPEELMQLVATIQEILANTSAAVPPAGTVDLEDVTSEPSTTEEDLITMPAPGTPG